MGSVKMGEQNIFMELVGIIIAGFTVEDDVWGLIELEHALEPIKSLL